jgi:hypothetical protein
MSLIFVLTARCRKNLLCNSPHKKIRDIKKVLIFIINQSTLFQDHRDFNLALCCYFEFYIFSYRIPKLWRAKCFA